MEPEENEEEDELSWETFQKALENVSTKHKEKYKFILKAGYNLKDAIFRFLSLVWRTEQIPEGWKKTLLIQLEKGKGSKCLENLRHIHIKPDISKVFGQILTMSVRSCYCLKDTEFIHYSNGSLWKQIMENNP